MIPSGGLLIFLSISAIQGASTSGNERLTPISPQRPIGRKAAKRTRVNGVGFLELAKHAESLARSSKEMAEESRHQTTALGQISAEVL